MTVQTKFNEVDVMKAKVGPVVAEIKAAVTAL